MAVHFQAETTTFHLPRFGGPLLYSPAGLWYILPPTIRDQQRRWGRGPAERGRWEL